MATKKKKLLPNKCLQCGRDYKEVPSHTQSWRGRRYTYYTCPCGQEWTVTALESMFVTRAEDPVSSDEVIEVHDLLKRDSSIADLLKRRDDG